MVPPTTNWAILAASNDVIAPLWPPDLEGVIVYEPAPNPFSEYVPSVFVDVDTGVEPAPLKSTLETNRVAGVPIALPYVTVPEMTAAAGVGVLVAVAAAVAVLVGVAVLVAVLVDVLTGVFVAVGVEPPVEFTAASTSTRP